MRGDNTSNTKKYMEKTEMVRETEMETNENRW